MALISSSEIIFVQIKLTTNFDGGLINPVKTGEDLFWEMGSIIPGFEYDIFISYRQKDNKHYGWVTEFVDNLKGTGIKFYIYQD